MPWQLSAVVVLFMSLAVILHYGSQITAQVFPETGDYPPTTAATAEATAKPFLQLTHHIPSQTLAAGSMDGHTTSHRAAPTSSSELPTTHTTVKTLVTTSLLTTNSTPTTSPTTHTLVTTLATPNNSHTAPSLTEATLGPSAGPGSRPTTFPPSAHTTGTSPSTVSHTTRKTTQPRNQNTLPATLSTPLHNSTTSHQSAQPSHAPGPTTAAHNTTHTASPAATTSGPTLAPRPSSAKTGMYQVLNGSRLCIKAEMGIELTVQDTESDENSYYISEVRAYLTVANPEKIYQGMKSSVVMFETVVGHSFKCVSEQSVQLSTHLQLKTMNVQYQAFDFEDDHFGNADECFTDRIRRENPVAVGLSIAVLLVVLLTACLVASKRPSRGYERM
ncbi:lysosome-associated membrane glycoprotein 3 isoform X3 [Meles meles]|uniref:lysosome-associated membrane glycoprotein 3 isoform X3 n=1 Tax=Meles meles TaxID=9662 RepID=UPI001E6A0181|nr:lysosome-associated membrane glycoprotein 3 isoform X3 [Meles meles]